MSLMSSQIDSDFHFGGFHNLMPHRVQNVLLVSSLYECFILEEEGLLNELITSEYLDLNLSHAPRVTRVSTAQEALESIRGGEIDLVITMTRLSGLSVAEFSKAVKGIRPNLPVVVLAGEPEQLFGGSGRGRLPGGADNFRSEHHGCIDRIFVWNGDSKMLLAIIKFVEDFLNVEHDTRVGDVRVIVLVENSVRFYSAYLPLIYTQVVRLTQSLIREGLNHMHRLLRLRARPKILLAETFEEAWELYASYSHHLLGVISDIRFPRSGRIDSNAGLEFTRRIRQDQPHLPVLLQSSDHGYAEAAGELRAQFLNKNSKNLRSGLRDFMMGNMGFGDFVFAMPDGTQVGRAHDLLSLEETIRQIPDESLQFHAKNNHLSNWLFARTEFELAAKLRPRKVSDFDDTDQMRAYLIRTLSDFREKSRAGLIADFTRKRHDKAITFTRIGGGSIGGKARGLAFVNALIRHHNLRHRYEDVKILVPKCAAIGTGVFELFMEKNNLRELVTEDIEDRQIISAFLSAEIPKRIKDDLADLLRYTNYPLAVRSSSLLEDAQDHPFAGIYATYMIPNNHEELGVRLAQLCKAVKLVFASTFLKPARRYLQATGRQADEEEMAVIVQELVGSQHGERFYPSFSGVARSYNYYPTTEMKPEQGVAVVALGLGRTVVEGEQCLMFSPAHPNILPQFPTTQDLLANSQRRFYALDISDPNAFPSPDEDANLSSYDLQTAEEDGTLQAIGSVYSAENDRVTDGVSRPGTRLVTFAHVLKANLLPLASILRELLDIGEDGMACPVEIEFAVDMTKKPARFGFLQIRPIIYDEETENVALDDLDMDEVILYSPQAMGHGRFGDICDFVYVKPDAFDSGFTREMAAEIGQINEQLGKEQRRYVLIGFGRWGSSDRWLGIPVTWDQISNAKLIVETSREDFMITPSQGTHFFQNLTSQGVGYFTINSVVNHGMIDWHYLEDLEAVTETKFVRHVRFDKPLEIKIDGRQNRGAVFKQV